MLRKYYFPERLSPKFVQNAINCYFSVVYQMVLPSVKIVISPFSSVRRIRQPVC